MRALQGVLLAMTLATSSACLTPYVFAPGEAKARVFVVDGENLTLLKDGEQYWVAVRDGTKYVSLPATGPVELGRHLVFYGYNVTYSCYPMATFTPEPGASYVIDVVIIDDGCRAHLVREDPETRTGVSIEPSAEVLRR